MFNLCLPKFDFHGLLFYAVGGFLGIDRCEKLLIYDNLFLAASHITFIIHYDSYQ